MSMLSFGDDAFAGYLAGFLDSEGCIEISKEECGIRIRLANTHRPTLDAIHERLGFGRIEEYRRPQKSHYKRLFIYAVSNAPDVERFLRLVRPYVSIKAEKADRALAIIGIQRQRMEDLDERNRQVLALIDEGVLQKEIAKRFNISQSLVSRIKSGHTWPTEINRFNARRGLKKGMRPSDQVFRLHGEPS
ncbi:MAG: hypothetical protein JRN42_08200 [Nitrososphaerota archaeon]|nr:hypothetical protein [Nitrososphaerota archaeon]